MGAAAAATATPVAARAADTDGHAAEHDRLGALQEALGSMTVSSGVALLAWASRQALMKLSIARGAVDISATATTPTPSAPLGTGRETSMRVGTLTTGPATSDESDERIIAASGHNRDRHAAPSLSRQDPTCQRRTR